MADDNLIRCAEHGDATATYVCEHLAMDPEQRWYCDYPSESNRWPDAWCQQCDAEFRKEGERNEKNEQAVKIKVICNYCYESGHASSIESVEDCVVESWRSTLFECNHRLYTNQESLESQFRLSRHKRWDYDQKSGLITFSNEGIPAVIADIEMIGSVSSVSETWLWSWANFHILPSVRERMVAVREFGEKNGFPRLTVPKWKADEADGWEMSAITAHVLDAEGVYRVPTEKGFLFMAMTGIRFAA
jgi:hypothetical protein